MDKPKSERPNTWFRELHCHRQPVRLQYWGRETFTDVYISLLRNESLYLKLSFEWNHLVQRTLNIWRVKLSQGILSPISLHVALALHWVYSKCRKGWQSGILWQRNKVQSILGNQRRLNWIAKKNLWTKCLKTKWNWCWWFRTKDMSYINIFGYFFEWICWPEHERRRKEIQLATTEV